MALTIFSLSVVSIAQSLQLAIRTAGILNHENGVRIGLRSFLEEVRRKPLAELTQTFVDERLGVTFNSTAEELDLKDRNGTLLRDLYKLRVVATYDPGDGQPREEALEVFIYKTKTQERQQQ